MFLLGVTNVQFVGILVVQVLDDLVFHDADHDDDVLDRELDEPVKNVAENRFSATRTIGFGFVYVSG